MSHGSALAAFARLARELALELLAPSACAACDARVPLRTLFCAACAATLLPAGRCSADDVAAFVYGGAIARAIVRLKYEARPDLGRPLADVLLRAAAPVGHLADVACPVPLHRVRLAERGYNQAALLGAPVARALGVAWRPRLLERTRDTPRQATLDRDARAENVVGAFRVRHARGHVRGARVLLVDDVRTTGATLAACRGALLDAGAHSVVCAVIARAEG